MRVLVTGGRDYRDIRRVFSALSAIHNHRKPITALIQGGSTGADAIARLWAENHNIESVTYRAAWSSHGRSAGPRRNSVMLADSRPDLVLAFPGGVGTADAVRKATRAGLEVIEVDE